VTCVQKPALPPPGRASGRHGRVDGEPLEAGLLGGQGAQHGQVFGGDASVAEPEQPVLAQRTVAEEGGGVRAAQRLRRKPGEPPEAVVAEARRQLADLHLRRSDWAVAAGFAVLNWLGDAACLVLSIRAAGLAVRFVTCCWPGRGRLSAARIGGQRLIPGLSARW